MSFINGDFLLHNATARELYSKYAADLPIFDYHCHISPRDIAENRQFANLFEIWLAGDHYKWRAMRANGIDEKYCTGDASDHEKFLAWAKTVPHTLRNPLYHWSHLELKRYFGIDTLIDEGSAQSIWNTTKELLAQPGLSVHGILSKFRVAVICTTDDPTDDLEYHKAIAASNLKTRVYPAFRPDNALKVDAPTEFNAWVDRLADASGTGCGSFDGFLDALKQRHDYFHGMGGRLSDHGMETCYADFCEKPEAAAIFDEARRGTQADENRKSRFATFMMVYFGHLDAAKGWTKQLHLGALRNNNSRRFKVLGPDTGFDSIGDFHHAAALNRYLDRLDADGRLPKTILYNNNPNDNYILASLIGNFQDGSIPGKLQFGSGWWHLDQKGAMEWQMNALSNVGLLSRFVGMLTDSRSFMSYCRHEYFRRVLCNMIGRDVENGELPDEEALLGDHFKNICYHNAERYFGIEPGMV